MNTYKVIVIYVQYNVFQVHAILKALPANTQPEKREFDKDAIKEQDNETDDKTETTKEQPKTDKDSEDA